VASSIDRRLSVWRLVVGLILCAVGAVWFGQGIGAIGGSFMTGEAIWAIFGAIAVLAGVTLLRRARLSRRH
jgi:hypothetical protein